MHSVSYVLPAPPNFFEIKYYREGYFCPSFVLQFLFFILGQKMCLVFKLFYYECIKLIFEKDKNVQILLSLKKYVQVTPNVLRI